MIKFSSKLIKGSESLENLDNKVWWEKNPMTYDWKLKLGKPILNKAWFNAIDNIFGEGHSLINNPRWPQGYILENFLPYSEFSKKNILEIGCGAGLVSSHIAKSGGNLYAIDLTPKAVEMTKKRFQINKLNGVVKQMDAITII